MACLYYDRDGKSFNSIQDLIHSFYVANFQVKNAAIFSAEEIQKSTFDKVAKISNDSSYNDSTSVTIENFITQPHPTLLREIPGYKGKDLLVPEVRVPERIYHYVLNNLDKAPTTNPANLEYSTENLTELKSRADLQHIPESKLIYLLSEIEGIMQHEERTKKFGFLLHGLVAKRLSGNEKGFHSSFSEFFNNEENKDIFGNYSEEEWLQKIDSIINVISKKVTDNGKPLSTIKIVSNGLVGIKGKIGLIAVDSSGDAHIFEIKISKTKYENWDSAKKLTLDWQLALSRQLLGQHINVDNTMLYTIPIYIPVLGDPNAIHLEEFVNRRSESGSGLNTAGKIYEAANQIIPKGIFVEYDPSREVDIKNELNILLPNYEVKTDFEDTDVKAIMANARKRYEKEKVWRKWNNFENIEGMEKGYMESKDEAEFEEMINKYVAHVKLQLNRNVSILKDAMISAIKTNQGIKTSSANPKKDITANHLLSDYLNEEWEVVNNIPETLPLGLIVLRNRRTNQVNVISLSINQLLAQSDIEGMNYGDLEYMKTLLFVNKFKSELLPNAGSKLGEIIVYNAESGQSYYDNVLNKYDEFRNLMSKKSELKSKLKLSKDNILGIEDVAMYNLDVNLRHYSGSDKEKVNAVFNLFQDTSLDQMDLDKLMSVLDSFFIAFPEYKNKSMTPELNFADPKEMLLALLQTAIVSRNQMNLSGDFQNMSNLSLGFSDFKSLVAALYTKDQANYDKQGRRIQGIVQGLWWTTPDWVASNDLRNINKIMATANSHIGERMLKANEKIHPLTKQFYEDVNYTSTSRTWVGNSQEVHKNLWATKDGTVSKDFKTKNPYKTDLDNQMTDAERKYLKQMLLIINTYSLDIPESIVKSLDANSLESISKNEKIKNAIESGKYFEMPLIRREELSRFGGEHETPGEIWKNRKSYWEELNDYLDTRELQKENLDAIELQRMGFYEMYDVYGRQTPDMKARILERHNTNYFEWNMDTIAHRIAFNKIRKQIFDRKLPIINAYLWWMKLLAGRENIDISKQLEYVANQMKLAVFDEPIIDDEFKDLTKTIGIVKSISTPMLLAFKPASMAKELVIGVIRGTTLAATQLYGEDQFGVADLTKAYGKLITIDNKFSEEFNLIDKINQMYRIANMDVNTMAQKIQTDRRGIYRGTGRWMYACNTIPDYFNRLSLLIAKMIHDGSYDAHTLVNGEFQYDPRKDKRFSYYLENREKYKDSQGRYIPKTGDEKYNKQRQHYLLIMQQLNDEYSGEGVETLTESDLIDKAYSAKERQSFKTFTDMAYGYYDKDAQSQSNNLWWGVAFLQFMQFWPGKMKMWFAKPTEAKDSPMGRFEQDFVMDDNQNKQLLWRKPRVDEDGEFMYEDGVLLIDLVTENTGDPALKWTGTAYEGLAYSLLYTIQDIYKLNFKEAFGNKERMNRVKFAMVDGLMLFLLLGLLKAMFDALVAENGTEGLSGNLLKFSAAVNTKVLNEYNVYNSTLGAVNSEPVFMSWGKKVGNDIWSVVGGEKTFTDALSHDVGAFEFMKDYRLPTE